VDLVIAGVAPDPVVPGTAVDHVVAARPRQPVSPDHVVSALAFDLLVTGCAEELVVPFCPDQVAMAGAAETRDSLLGIPRGRIGLDDLLAPALIDVTVRDPSLLAIGVYI
jgi:hypothetical protein